MHFLKITVHYLESIILPVILFVLILRRDETVEKADNDDIDDNADNND